MARTRSIRRSGKKKTTKDQNNLPLLKFLPDHIQSFIARRLVDLFAVTLTFSGLFLIIALLSYNSTDPSWNTAIGGENQDIANWMGSSGAWVADLLLQTLGLGALIFGFAFLLWGVRIFNRQPIGRLWLRSLAGIFAALSFSIAFSKIPSEDWLTHDYMGSSAGTLMLAWLAPLGESLFSWLNTAVIISICGFLGLSASVYTLAFTKAELAFAAIKTWNFTAFISLTAMAIIQNFMYWLRHHNSPGDAPKPFEAFKGLPKLSSLPKPKIAPRVAPEIDVQEPVRTMPEPAPISTPAPAKTPSANIPVVTTEQAQAPKTSPQQKFSLEGEEWDLPAISLLEAMPEGQDQPQLNEDALRRNAELLQNVLADFNVEGEITSIHPGPVVTLYELEPAPGVKSAKVIGLADDIARSMSAVSVRVAVVPGRNVIGIELPNKTRQFVYMQELLASQMFEKSAARLPLILGKDIGGKPILADLAKMPHLLVAGTTGSGKSVAVNTMILSLLYALSPEKCRFIMIDPKMLELSVYDGIPHLLTPVVTEPGKAVVALKWVVNEMEERYRAMSKLGVRNIDGYNERIREALSKGEEITQKMQTGFDPDTGAAIYEDQPMELAELPYIVVIVDEFADLMLVAGKDVEGAIQRLAQMARAAGIHLIMATQRPSVDVITGVIKANFPTRISFQVTSKVDSRTILGEGGAEQLLGMGDMLYMAPGGRITRVHGPFVSDNDVEKVVRDLKSKAEPAYIDSITSGEGLDASEVMNAIFEERGSGDEKVDELYDQAVALVAREGKASTSFVQRYLQIGYNRAARIIEEMERQGVISPASPTGKREVLVRDFSDA